jgi:DMSO reductase anchor subunit
LLEVLILCLVALTGVIKLVYWRQCDADKGQYTAEMATGLGDWGKVRPLDPPHTRPNFVMREMGYQVGRKHAAKLRRIVILFMIAGPVLALALAAMTGIFTPFWYLLATAMTIIGIVTERWLFFAEAEHVSMLFYGAERA